MMASLAGVTKEDDKEVARKMFRAGDVNKQVDDVSSYQTKPSYERRHYAVHRMKQALKQTLRATCGERGKVTCSFVFTCDWL